MSGISWGSRTSRDRQIQVLLVSNAGQGRQGALGLQQGSIAGETEELGGVECGTCVTCAQLGKETREITPFPSFLLLISYVITVQHVL